MKTLLKNMVGRVVGPLVPALALALCLHGLAGSAQTVRSRVYGTATGTEELGTMIPLNGGGYLMVGSSYTLPVGGNVDSSTLYLLRLRANGDTLWTKKLLLPGCFGFYPPVATEDANGRVLVAGRSFTYSGITQGDAFLAMLNPQGDTLWTKRVASIVDDVYYKAQLLPSGDFLVSGQVNNAPVLMRLTAAGQVVWQQNLVYAPGDTGGIREIIPVAGSNGQYWIPLGSSTPPYPYRFVRYDSNGPTGLMMIAPAGVLYTEIVPIGTEYLMVNGVNVKRVDANFNPLWNQSPTAQGLQTSFKKIVATGDGNFLVGGEAGTGRLTLNKISPSGLSLADTVFSRFGQVFMRGLAIDPASGDYVFAGQTDNGPIGLTDVFWTQWRRSRVSGTRTAVAPGLVWSAYPNPLLDNAVTLQAEEPLRGTLHLHDALGRRLGTWAAAGQRTQVLPLSPALPAGVYLLTLESPGAAPRTLRLLKP